MIYKVNNHVITNNDKTHEASQFEFEKCFPKMANLAILFWGINNLFFHLRKIKTFLLEIMLLPYKTLYDDNFFSLNSFLGQNLFHISVFFYTNMSVFP